MHWQPISEAPKDGTEVFLWVDGKMIKGFYSNTSYLWVESDGYAECQPTDFLVITPPGEQQPDADLIREQLLNCHQRMREQAATISELKATLVSKCREQQPESVNQRLLQASEHIAAVIDAHDTLSDNCNGTDDRYCDCLCKATAKLEAAIELAKQATKGTGNEML